MDNAGPCSERLDLARSHRSPVSPRFSCCPRSHFTAATRAVEEETGAARPVPEDSPERTMTDPSYDLLLRGGVLLDPGQGVHQRRDVAFTGGRVACVAENIDSAAASQALDVSGKLVTPGLIDIHGHYYHGSGALSVDARAERAAGGSDDDRGCGVARVGPTTGPCATTWGQPAAYGCLRFFISAPLGW